MNIIHEMYSDKKPILCLNSAKLTNTAGPAGIGISMWRKTKTPAKYSNIALVLDALFVHKTITCQSAKDGSRFFFQAGEAYGCCESTPSEKHLTLHGYTLASDGTPHYANDIKNRAFSLAPFFFDAYYCSTNTEFKTIIDEIASDIKDIGVTDPASVLKACDSFYYGYVKTGEFNLTIDNEHSLSEFQASYLSGSMPVSMGVTPSLLRTGGQTPISDDDVFDYFEKKPETGNPVLQNAKEGKYLIPFEWNEKMKKNIPDLSYLDSFIPSKIYYTVLSKISKRVPQIIARMDAGYSFQDSIGKDILNLLMLGKPGTGKTTIWYALGATFGFPVVSIPLTKSTDDDTFQGMTKAIDGKFLFKETPFLDAFQNGGIIILEEINLADPAVTMGCLGQATEYPYILMKNGYETIHRHPLCIIAGTMNIGTAGSKPLNQALSSRFKQSFIMNDPKKEEFIDILLSMDFEKKKVNWVYEAYEKIVSYLLAPERDEEEIALAVTLRSCIGALEEIEDGSEPRQALRNTMVGKIAEVDLALAEEVYDSVVSSLKDPKF